MEVLIERILPGGLGLAHAEGKTIMVALAAPGDRLRVRIDRVKGNVSFASITEIIEGSPVRVEPPCPYFGRCGGCDFQQMSYQAQLDAKVEIIRDCLRRIGGIEKIPEIEITATPNQWHYRSRAQWQYDAERKRLGYFEAQSRRVCDVAECAVLTAQLQQTLANLRELMQEGSLPHDARDFRAIGGDDEISIADNKGRNPTVREGARSEPPAEAGGQLAATHPTVRGDSHVRDITSTVHGEQYRLNAESFFQTNVELLPQLIDTALAEASGRMAIELYCGVGLFTLPLARRFKSVIGVEDNTAAATFARANLDAAGLTNVSIANADVADWLEENLECAGLDGALDFPSGPSSPPETLIQSGVEAAARQNGIEFLLLDPPRTGAESRVIAGILQLRPRRICYISCDPATLARDLKKLISGGYSLDSLAAFDMFPQTHHVETVVHLSG